MSIVDRLTLPTQVRARVGIDVDEPLHGVTCIHRRRSHVEERRSTAELRVADDGTIGIHGYASVTEVPYDVAGGPPWGWTETIARGAFRSALAERDDVRLLVEHEGLPLARTVARTLTLEEDDMGLLAEAPSLDLARNPRVQELHSVLDRGDADQMSFAFRATRQEWNDDYTERRILEVRLYDVSVVTFPASPATVVALRNAGTIPATEPRGMSLATARAFADHRRLSPHAAPAPSGTH